MTPIVFALKVLKYWKYIVITLLSLLLVLSLSYINNLSDDIILLQTKHELELTSLKAEYVNTAREIERKAYAQQIEAINEYKQREEVILASVDSANESVSRLSNTLNQVSSAAKYDASLRDKYIDTSRGIIEECTVGYRQVGEIAERLNSEVKLLRDSRK